MYFEHGHLPVSRTLWNFLQALFASGQNEWFWADQISMNQLDVDERNHQVTMMSMIYSQAVEVYAWLGPQPDAWSSRSSGPSPLRPLRDDNYEIFAFGRVIHAAVLDAPLDSTGAALGSRRSILGGNACY
jgi:hypothetical protein